MQGILVRVVSAMALGMGVGLYALSARVEAVEGETPFEASPVLAPEPDAAAIGGICHGSAADGGIGRTAATSFVTPPPAPAEIERTDTGAAQGVEGPPQTAAATGGTCGDAHSAAAVAASRLPPGAAPGETGQGFEAEVVIEPESDAPLPPPDEEVALPESERVGMDEPEPARPKSAPRAKPTSNPAPTAEQRAAAAKTWWPPSRPAHLTVLFVGEAAFGSAISVLTDGTFDQADSAGKNIRVVDGRGRSVPAKWSLAINKKMLLLAVSPGVYTVSLEPGLADATGRTLGAAASGFVIIR